MTNEEIRDEFMKLAKTGWVEATDILKLRDAVLDRLTPPAPEYRELYLDDMRIHIYFETAAKPAEELTPPAQPHELVAKVREIYSKDKPQMLDDKEMLRLANLAPALADLCERLQASLAMAEDAARKGESARLAAAGMEAEIQQLKAPPPASDIEAKARRAAEEYINAPGFHREKANLAAIIARVFAGGGPNDVR